MNGRKLDNYSKTLRNLEASRSYLPPYDAVTEAGLVSLYQICLELSWKAMKQALEEQGYAEAQTGSPRKVIKCAYSAGMIDNEQGWIDALNSRNLLAHTYNDAVAQSIIEKTRSEYIPMFQKLETELRENW